MVNLVPWAHLHRLTSCSGAILADPDTNEEELADGTLTLVLNGAEGKLAYMLKTGKASLSLSQLKNCLKVAQDHIPIQRGAVSAST